MKKIVCLKLGDFYLSIRQITQRKLDKMEPPKGFEPSTCYLRNSCSTN